MNKERKKKRWRTVQFNVCWPPMEFYDIAQQI